MATTVMETACWLVLRIDSCGGNDGGSGEDDEHRSRSLLVIHVQSNKREASNQHAATKLGEDK